MSFGGKFDYAKEYSKYRPQDNTKFESYVDKYPDLTAAWGKIESDPDHPDSQYWIKRGATSKSAFGRAHAAEDMALKTGDYHGGAAGRTDYMPGTDAWKTLFPGDDPTTRFESWLDTGSSSGNGNGNGGSPARGGGAPGSTLYPMGLVDYTEPEAMEGIPLAYQPWIQPDHIPDSLWNYQPPTLAEWEVRPGDWSWAEKDVSEYLTDDQKAAKAAAAAQTRGDRNGGDERDTRFSQPYGYVPGLPGEDDQMWDYSSDPSEESTTPISVGQLTGMIESAFGSGLDFGEPNFEPMYSDHPDYG